jgi:carbamoyltransferase
MHDFPSIHVLGIHDGHNAGAALVRDGKIIAAINEERLNNIKNFAGVPRLAIRKVLTIAGITPSQIKAVAVASRLRVDDPVKEDWNPLQIIAEQVAPFLHGKWFIDRSVQALFRLRKTEELRTCLAEIGIGLPLTFIDHHVAHAACAYYSRPWEEKTLVLTLDGMGDGVSSTVSIGDGFEIKRIAQSSFYDSLCNNLCSEITAYLGMKRWEHEYKVMGLAPYGNPDSTLPILREVIRINPRNPLEFENTSGHYLKRMQRVYHRRLAGKRFDHVAAGTQTLFEELVVQWVRNAVRQTGVASIVGAGGGFLNVKTNKLLREMPEVERIFFYPAAEDGGLAAGASMEAYVRLCERQRIRPGRCAIADIYYGAESTALEIEDFLSEKKLLSRARRVTAGELAKLLTEGKIFGRFAGRDEWGPRGLGNRSILADPRHTGIVRKLNFAIKQRDFWMPFAPAILEEDMARYLVNPRFAPYMIEAFDTTPAGQEIIAGLHPFDLTARPQTVNEWNPALRAILVEFKRLTGVGALLNTSFNLHGYPMVGSLEAAYATLQGSQLDGLILGDWLISK